MDSSLESISETTLNNSDNRILAVVEDHHQVISPEFVEIIDSLSGDDNHKGASTKHMKALTLAESDQLTNVGFCELTDIRMHSIPATGLINRWILSNCGQICSHDVLFVINLYFGGCYDERRYLRIKNVWNPELPKYYLTARINLKLWTKLCNRLHSRSGSNVIEINKTKPDILEAILTYLAHHKGIEPEPIAKPIRSVRMERICADVWDANFMNSMTKKKILQIILVANQLDIQPLLHLGCAKIATLTKGKSPEEIKEILADNDIV